MLTCSLNAVICTVQIIIYSIIWWFYEYGDVKEGGFGVC